MLVQRLTLFLCFVAAFLARAQEAKPARKGIESNRLMHISYGSASWNTDSRKIDSAYLVLRDKTTGKIVQIQLEETEPDSSQFNGQFSVNLGESEKISPEIFIPPGDMRAERDSKRLYEQIKNNKLQRKPLIWKKTEKGQALIDVYDTREQAQAALAAFQEEQRLAQEAKSKKAVKPIPNEAALAAAKQAEHQAMLEKLALDAAKRETERVRMEQIERQKAEERERQAKAASEKERARRREQASQIAAEAIDLYGKGNYQAAEPKFREAVDLDPENKSYYYQYGITLYRNEKYNEALVVFKLGKLEGQQAIDKHYFMGLTHYRLKEIEPALDNFKIVADSSDPQLGPSARFYMGVIQFTQENFETAKKSFETVIDTSNDPRLDEQAETYLDQIAGAMAFQKMRENKFTFIGVVGPMYDSNVLLSPDSSPDQGSETNISDVRLLTMGDLEYRGIFTQKHEFGAKANATLINSLKDEAAPADPFLYNLSLPYSYKGVIGSKGLKFSVKPAYEMLYMAPTGGSTKELVFTSYVVAFDTTLIMSPTWFSGYVVEYRGDDSKLSSSVGDEDSDATKYSLRTTQSFFMDKARKQALIGSFGYVKNAARGDNKKYNRFELGAMFMKPIRWDTSWNLGLSVFQAKYPDEDDSRSDFNTTLSTGISKPIKEWFIWGVTASYSKNDSNVSSYEYSKFTVMTTGTFITNF